MLHFILSTARLAWHDALALLEGHSAQSLPSLIPQLVVGLVAGAVIYVPVHELLHALGCVLVGGSVSEVEIAPAFGGRLLESLLPFVSSETEYAGRLSGFDVGGSDLRLLVTDFAPYGLTIFVGVPLLRRLQRRPRAWLSGGALLVALAPWISLPGDYYEMGSTIVTGVLWWAGGDWSTLRSDDLFALVGGITGEPAAYGFDGIIGTATGAAVIVASICAAVSLAALTYAAGSAIALEPTTLELDESSDSKS